MTDAPDFLRAGEIARLSGVSVRTVRRWIADEIVPSVKVRGARLVPRRGLERVLAPTADWDGDPREESKGITDD
jgi:excisionase family DNA binding protein